MTVVVAYTAQDSARSALELASVLSRSTGEPLVVAVVVATPHTSGGADFVDGDYLGPLTEWGQSVLEEARSSLAPDIEATFEVRHASSIPGGLLELAAEIDASAMVLGSSSKGSLGRISLGSVTNRLVHMASLPVLLAPRGYRPGPTSRIRRVNIGFGGPTGGTHVALVGARLANLLGAELRAVSFAVRPPKRLYGSVEESADDLVVDRWVSRTREGLLAQVGAMDTGLADRLATSLVVGEGVSWGKAIWDVDWSDGDLLVVGPSSSAPAARLFLGSRASKILRSAPVPVFMAPAPRAG
ncbi:universal stress protein [Dermatophilaceae bacterium Soc4.6]